MSCCQVCLIYWGFAPNPTVGNDFPQTPSPVSPLLFPLLIQRFALAQVPEQ